MKRPSMVVCLCASIIIFSVVFPLRSLALEGHQNPTLSGSTSQVQAFYYQTVPGKVMGVWPVDYSVQNLANLRLRYGFTHIAVIPDTQVYDNARRAGFEPSNIMIDLWDPQMTVDKFPCGIYYRDEPVEHDCSGHNGAGHLYSPTELSAISDYVHQNRPGSLFVISGYKRCSHLSIAAGYADAVMYSAYTNWSVWGFLLCHVNIGWGDSVEAPWTPDNQDQRDSWTSMKSTFSSKFSMTWVNGASDEYSNLFGHANYLGLQGIWKWDPGPVDSSSLEAYCQIAWQNGWMNRIPFDSLLTQFASFTARVTGNNEVMLQWVTLTEPNNFGFDVQRRSGPTDTFATVRNGFVPAAGTTKNVHEYMFVDSTAGAGRLWYRLKQIDLDGSESYSPIQEVAEPTGVSEEDKPVEFLLCQNYPNPFNPATKIQFTVVSSQLTIVRVFDVLGREVATLVNEVKQPGTYTVQWEASEAASGVYYYRIQVGDYVAVKKMLLVR